MKKGIVVSVLGLLICIIASSTGSVFLWMIGLTLIAWGLILACRKPRRILTLDFDEDSFKRLQGMCLNTESKSIFDLIRNALRVYKWVSDKEKQGYKFALKKGNTITPVELSF